MSDFARVAIVGTGQLAETAAEQTGTAVDSLVGQLAGLPRERSLLLRAGGLGLLQRAAQKPAVHKKRAQKAAEEQLAAPSGRLVELLATLVAPTNEELLIEALTRMAEARIRLPEELLPLMLSRTSQPLRVRILPVLGERGVWLARHQSEWSWAARGDTSAALPENVEERFSEGTAAERRHLLALLRSQDPQRARKLMHENFKQEKADQRFQWVELLEPQLSLADEPLLEVALSDRSAQVRNAAAQMLWLLPDSQVSFRIRQRADALISLAPPSQGVVARLRGLVGVSLPGSLSVQLPPEEFDPSWEKDGISEEAQEGHGRRQWWLLQLVSVVPPDHWVQRFGMSPDKLVVAALEHEFSEVLLKGFVRAAVRHGARHWYAPLYDVACVAHGAAKVRISLGHLQILTRGLTAQEAEPRMLGVLETGRFDGFSDFARPWPMAVAKRFLRDIHKVQPGVSGMFRIAAASIPVDMLPERLELPVPADSHYGAQTFQRDLEQYNFIANTRRAIAQEIPL